MTGLTVPGMVPLLVDGGQILMGGVGPLMWLLVNMAGWLGWRCGGCWIVQGAVWRKPAFGSDVFGIYLEPKERIRTLQKCQILVSQGENTPHECGTEATCLSYEQYRALSNGIKTFLLLSYGIYRGADKSLDWPGKKQATVTEDFEFHISYL